MIKIHLWKIALVISSFMNSRFITKAKHCFIVGVTTSLLLACSNTSELSKNLKNINLPATWQGSTDKFDVKDNWLLQLGDPKIQQLVKSALTSNHQLKIQAYNV